MVWYYIGVYTINKILHGCLEIRNFSCVENISLVRCTHLRNIFQHSKRNFVSPHSHVKSSISVSIHLENGVHGSDGFLVKTLEKKGHFIRKNNL